MGRDRRDRGGMISVTSIRQHLSLIYALAFHLFIYLSVFCTTVRSALSLSLSLPSLSLSLFLSHPPSLYFLSAKYIYVYIYWCVCVCVHVDVYVCAHRCMYRRYHQNFYVWKNQFCSVTAHTTRHHGIILHDATPSSDSLTSMVFIILHPSLSLCLPLHLSVFISRCVCMCVFRANIHLYFIPPDSHLLYLPFSLVSLLSFICMCVSVSMFMCVLIDACIGDIIKVFMFGRISFAQSPHTPHHTTPLPFFPPIPPLHFINHLLLFFSRYLFSLLLTH